MCASRIPLLKQLHQSWIAVYLVVCRLWFCAQCGWVHPCWSSTEDILSGWANWLAEESPPASSSLSFLLVGFGVWGFWRSQFHDLESWSMFQCLREVDSTIWNLQLFHGNYPECNFYTNSLEFDQQLLHQNFGFLKLDWILIGVYQIQWHTTFTPETWDFWNYCMYSISHGARPLTRIRNFLEKHLWIPQHKLQDYLCEFLF